MPRVSARITFASPTLFLSIAVEEIDQACQNTKMITFWSTTTSVAMIPDRTVVTTSRPGCVLRPALAAN